MAGAEALRSPERVTAIGCSRAVSDIPVGAVDNNERDPEADRITREIYGGYERSYHPQGLYAGDEEYYVQPNQTIEYVDDGEYRHHQFFLHGAWTNARPAARDAVDISCAAPDDELLWAVEIAVCGSAPDQAAQALETLLLDHDGVVRAFHNTCRHHAAKILPGWIGGLAAEGHKPRVAVARTEIPNAFAAGRVSPGNAPGLESRYGPHRRGSRATSRSRHEPTGCRYRGRADRQVPTRRGHLPDAP